VLFFVALGLAGAAFGESSYAIGGRWLVEGEGTAKKDILRVNLFAEGTMDIKSATEDGTESILGYESHATLDASRLGINAWEHYGSYQLPIPVPVSGFDPSMSEPFRLPPFTIDMPDGALTYTVELTSVHSGTVNISGYINLDIVDRTDINANCAIWREGTPKPDMPEKTWGCDAGSGWASLFASVLLGAAFYWRKRDS
jgi:hypothetical protein